MNLIYTSSYAMGTRVSTYEAFDPGTGTIYTFVIVPRGDEIIRTLTISSILSDSNRRIAQYGAVASFAKQLEAMAARSPIKSKFFGTLHQVMSRGEIS